MKKKNLSQVKNLYNLAEEILETLYIILEDEEEAKQEEETEDTSEIESEFENDGNEEDENDDEYANEEDENDGEYANEEDENDDEYENEETPSDIIRKFLIGPSDYDFIFESYKMFDVDDSLIKFMIMKNILNKAYLYYLHALFNNFLQEDSDNIDIDKINLEKLSEEFNIQLFYSDEIKDINIVKDIINMASMFNERNYLFTTICLEEIIAKGYKRKLFEVNPFIIFEFEKFQQSQQPIKTHLIINQFLDCYECANLYTRNFDLDKEQSVKLERIVLDWKLRNIFGNDTEKVYSYIFTNIYEYIKYKYFENDVDIDYMEADYFFPQYIEHDSIDFNTLITMYMQTKEFYDFIIFYFLESNLSRTEDYYKNIRKNISRNGGIKVLKKFNPYYSEEKRFFKRNKS